METTALATILAVISAHGCHVESVWPDGGSLSWFPLARVEIVALAKDGSTFVSLWEYGYIDSEFAVHTHKIVRWSSDDPQMEVELIDDRGRWWRIMALVPGQDVDALAQWQEWLAYRAANAERLAVIDAAVRQLQLEQAETWPE